MNDLDTKLREAFHDLADEAPTEPLLPARLRRRIRRARFAGAAIAAGVGVALVVGAVFGVTALAHLRTSSTQQPGGSVKPGETVLASPVAWSGIFPADTQEKAKELQACADAGDDSCTGYLDLQNVLRSYAKFQWESEIYFTQPPVLSDPDAAGPLTVTVGQCPPEGGTFPPGCTLADVTAERLLRSDHTGVWFVTAAHQYVTGTADDVAKAQVKTFVTKFMVFRVKGIPGAVDFLSADAKAAYESHDGGLQLFGTGATGNGLRFETYAVDSIEAPTLAGHLPSFHVTVTILARIEPGDTTAENIVEALIVGPGTDSAGMEQPFVIRSVTLTSTSPTPAP